VVGYRQSVPEDITDVAYELRERITDLAESLGYEPWEIAPSQLSHVKLSRDNKLLMEEIGRLIRESSDFSAALALAKRFGVVRAKPIPAKASATRPPSVQLVVLVLLWLILVVGPVAGENLPNEIQTMLSTEVGTVALGIAITQWITQKRK
jgi:hypothetical protein